MLAVIVQALYFFLPAYAANAAPVLLDRYRLFEGLKVPVDLGRKFEGQPFFGATKTYRGVLGGVAAAMAVVIVQSAIHSFLPQREYLYLISYPLLQVLWLGFLMGLGEGLGDLAKSFIKRRLGMKSGKAFFPLDQCSFIGALLLGGLYYMPPQGHILAIMLISPIVPVIANLVAYKTGLKKVWW